MELSEIKKPIFYTSKEVAEFMGISKMTLYRLIKYGKLKAINRSRTGNKSTFVFRAEDVQEYYDSLQSSIKRIESVNKPNICGTTLE